MNVLQDNDLIGKIAYSKAGRDKDKGYIIIGKIDDNYVLVADGKKKTINKPKRKRLKHLNLTCEVANEIKDSLLSDERDIDIKIKSFLILKAIVKEV
ncbi:MULTISPECIES: KOW domain-containing RNA-binding protein [Clostridium]|uniref:KOW domain-containing RNA-binding protein n=1 Tax=Clostridium TaxID=1485 RepID=UPI001FA88C6B|nr:MULTISPECIES: KOW domain-containing RNA-binding protein [Clostridium]